MLFSRNKFNNYIIIFLILELFSFLSFSYSNLFLPILIITNIENIYIKIPKPTSAINFDSI